MKDPLDFFPRPDSYKSKFMDNENTVAPKYTALGGLISVDNDAGRLADERTYVSPEHLQDIRTTTSISSTRPDLWGNTYGVNKSWVKVIGPPFQHMS